MGSKSGFSKSFLPARIGPTGVGEALHWPILPTF
jgi:hypothetical protein